MLLFQAKGYLATIYFQNKKNEDYKVVNFLIEIYISQTIYFWNHETKPIEWFLRPEVTFFSDFFCIGMEMQHITTMHFLNQEIQYYYIKGNVLGNTLKLVLIIEQIRWNYRKGWIQCFDGHLHLLSSSTNASLLNRSI